MSDQPPPAPDTKPAPPPAPAHPTDKRKVCNHPDGCTTKVASVKTGLCFKHGGRGKCSEKGCETNAQTSGRCGKHGGNGPCTFPECKTTAASKGLCVKHGGGSLKICTVPNCTTKVQSRSLCFKHGGGSQKLCKIEGCPTKAETRVRPCTLLRCIPRFCCQMLSLPLGCQPFSLFSAKSCYVALLSGRRISL